MKPPKKADLIYTAGLFDGEGSVMLCQHYTNGYRTPRVSLSSTTPALVRYMKCTYRGSVCSKRTYKKHHKPSWTWTLEGHAALRFIGAILPYLKEPSKIRRGKFLIGKYQKVTARNGRYTPQQRAAKEKFERDFVSL